MGLNQHTTDANGTTLESMLFKNKTITLYGGGGILFDDDGDTKMAATTPNQLDVYVAGGLDFSFTTNLFAADADSAFGGAGSNIVPMAPVAAEQRISGAGAATITERYTAWTTTAADAGTLADGAQYGQIKKIHLVVDGGDLTLTPANLFGGTTITYADAGDYTILQWNNSAWVMIESGNTVDGVSAPVLA